MACSYADGLSPYENKGKLGLKEIFDDKHIVKEKAALLADWILSSNHVVFHTGAGISTSAGIPDFRGPNGVWTLEAKGVKPSINVSFNDAVPTVTHMSLVKLVNEGVVKYVVSQNIDGLHLKSGLPRRCHAELHGNMFIEQCNSCKRQFVRKTATTSVGEKCLGTKCPGSKIGARPCRGKVHDTILDWEAGLPENDLDMAEYHSSIADLNVCLGTTLQIIPSGNLPLKCKKFVNGKLVICNLQPTKHDKKADLIINTYVDDMMMCLMELLDLKYDKYKEENDPTKSNKLIEWTIPDKEVKEMEKIYRCIVSKSIKNKQKGIIASKIKKRKKDISEYQEDKTVQNELETKLNNIEGIKREQIKPKGQDLLEGNSDLKLEELLEQKRTIKLEDEKDYFKEPSNHCEEILNKPEYHCLENI